MYVFGKSVLRNGVAADFTATAACTAPRFLTEGTGAFPRSRASIFFASAIRSRSEGAAASVAGFLAAVGGRPFAAPFAARFSSLLRVPVDGVDFFMPAVSGDRTPPTLRVATPKGKE